MAKRIKQPNKVKQPKDPAKYPYPDVGERLKKVRELLKPDMNQKDFAEKYGFRPKSWNHWEQGKSMPWMEAKKFVKQVPGLTLDYLYLNELRGPAFDWVERLRP